MMPAASSGETTQPRAPGPREGPVVEPARGAACSRGPWAREGSGSLVPWLPAQTACRPLLLVCPRWGAAGRRTARASGRENYPGRGVGAVSCMRARPRRLSRPVIPRNVKLAPSPEGMAVASRPGRGALAA